MPQEMSDKLKELMLAGICHDSPTLRVEAQVHPADDQNCPCPEADEGTAPCVHFVPAL